MADLKIRQYQDGDHDAVWELHNVALNLIGVHAGNGAWDDDLHHIRDVYLTQKGEFYVGVLAGELVAMGALQRVSEDKAEIKRMRVSPGFQRRGFGQAILNALEERARALGYQTLCLDTAVQQTAARGLYEKNGYREIGRTVLGGFDVVLYEKPL